MSSIAFGRCALSISAAATLLAGCGGAQIPIAAPSAANVGIMRTVHYLYAIAPKNSELHVYRLAGRHQEEIAHIDNLPAAHAVGTDGSGNVYVSDSGRAEVQVYAPLKKVPFLTLKDRIGTNVPWGVAVSGAGDVAVANDISEPRYRPSHVSFFHRGATHPYATFTNTTSFAQCTWVAYDEAGNLYVAGQTANGHGALGEIVDGGDGSKLENLHVSGLSRSIGGVVLDASGDIVVAQATRLSVFAPHSNRLLRTIPLGRGIDAKGLVLTPSGSDFYVANDKLNPAQLWEYHYPSGGSRINAIHVVPQGHPPVVEVSGLAIGP